MTSSAGEPSAPTKILRKTRLKPAAAQWARQPSPSAVRIDLPESLASFGYPRFGSPNLADHCKIDPARTTGNKLHEHLLHGKLGVPQPVASFRRLEADHGRRCSILGPLPCTLGLFNRLTRSCQVDGVNHTDILELANGASTRSLPRLPDHIVGTLLAFWSGRHLLFLRG
jgi:hypothetical protein